MAEVIVSGREQTTAKTNSRLTYNIRAYDNAAELLDVFEMLKVIPKATVIELPRQWVRSVINHDYSSESVAFAQVLKVFMWIVQNKEPVVTNKQIANRLNISESTVCSAKNVLQYEYENITKRKVSEKRGDDFISLGQELAASAFWKEL